MQYQDAAAESAEIESGTPEARREPSVRLWQHQETGRAQRILSAPEVDNVLSRPAPIRRHQKPTASVRRIHHMPRRQEAHGAYQPERHLLLPPAGEFPKRILDVVGAVTLALFLSPLLLIVGLMLAHDHGPIIYSHSRTGRHGKMFSCLKFRTMVPNADQVLRDLLHQNSQLKLEWMRDQKLRDDPRVTAIGRFLRRTSLDELPQLWNVLRGDMSLVGPRPVVREEWEHYGRRLDTYLAAKPGVTGLWQVMGRSDSSYRRRVALDSFYVRKRSLYLDVVILFRTVKVVLQGRGAY